MSAGQDLGSQLKRMGLVLAELEHGPKRYTPLLRDAAKGDITQKQIQNTLIKLLNMEQVVRPERGLYKITKRGKSQLAALRNNEKGDKDK